MMKKLFLLIFFFSFSSYSEELPSVFIRYQEELFRILGGNDTTSSYVFSRIIGNKVKEKKLVKIEKVRCRITDKYYLDTTKKGRDKSYNVLYLRVTDCARQSGFGAKDLPLVSIYVLGKDSFVRYERLGPGRVVLFSQVAVPSKKNLIGYAY